MGQRQRKCLNEIMYNHNDLCNTTLPTLLITVQVDRYIHSSKGNFPDMAKFFFFLLFDAKKGGENTKQATGSLFPVVNHEVKNT